MPLPIRRTPLNTNNETNKVKPLYQAPQLTMPERLELSMNKPDVVQLAKGTNFKQGRKFIMETGLIPGFYQEGGKLGEDFMYDRWRRSLPENLQAESPDYNLRGYWESLNKPELFNPMEFQTEDDGLYHASSRNPETGEQLKGKLHPTFYHALNQDKNAGYATVVKDGKTYTLNEFEEVGVNKDKQRFNKLPVSYEEKGTNKKSNKKIPIKRR